MVAAPDAEADLAGVAPLPSGMTDPSLPHRRTYPWTETRPLLAALDERWSLVAHEKGGSFASPVDPRVTFTPPLLQALRPGFTTPTAYLAALPPAPGRVLLVLLQAGAAALGLWDGDELLAHKAIKKYVVRGHGRAQPLHLSTRGKSRYGSRLRLRNAQRLLDELVAKAIAWQGEFGPFDAVLHSASPRAWGELLRQRPAPPFPTGPDCRRIPLDVHVPCFEELRRVRRHVARGSYTMPAPPPEERDEG